MGTLTPVLAAVLALAWFSPQASAAEDTPQSLQKKCDAKDWESCSLLGSRYVLGEGGVAIDHPKATALFERACNANYGDACTSLALMYDGSTRPLNPAKQEQLFMKACELKAGSGCYNLGSALLKGHTVLYDLERGLKLLNQACDMKEGEACFELFEVYAFGEKIAKDEARANAFYERACDLNSMSCILNFNEFLIPNTKACDEGKAWNCLVVGTAYLQGEAYLTVDEKKAASYLQKACDGREFAACGMIGWIYDQGEQTKRDASTAAGYYQKGCTGEDPYSCQQLGVQYILGKGVPEDASRAAVFLQSACEANKSDIAYACYLLGTVYAEGSGVKKDPGRAAILYAKACRLGDEEACTAAKAASPAGPRAKPAVATTTATTPAAIVATTAKPAASGCSVAKVQVGTDTAASVKRDITRRGDSPSDGVNNGKLRLSALAGDYSDVGSAIMAVNYSFDAAGDSARLTVVHIVTHANSKESYAKLLAERKAATDAAGKNASCAVRLVPNADTWFIHEFYELK